MQLIYFFQKKSFSYILLIISIVIFSCNSQRSYIDYSKLKDIDINDSSVTLDLSKIFSGIKYIPLETTKVPIGKVDKLLLRGQYFFILDKYLSKAFYVYDSLGNFLYSKQGIQYNMGDITDFDIDIKNKKIFLYSANSHKIVILNSINGNKIKEISISGKFFKFNCISEGGFLFLRDGVSHFNGNKEFKQNRICFFDSSGEYIEGWLNFPIILQQNYGMIYSSSMLNNNSIAISREYGDTVYSFVNDKLFAMYKLNFNNNNLSSTSLNTQSPSLLESYLNSKGVSYLVKDFVETDNVIMFYYYKDGEINLYWFNKNTKQKYSITSFNNDINHITLGNICSATDNKVISVIEPTSLFQEYNAVSSVKSFANKFSALISLTQKLKNASNPIIAIYSIK